MELLPGRYPAIVKTYDQASRMCRVDIPGITDGGDVFPLAEIEYAIGDKSRAGSYETEIEILAGDTVWVAFIGGDPRYPIITGWRNPQAGNSVDWRRWHHKNIELLATELINHWAGTDDRIKAGNDLQFQAAVDALTKAGQNVKIRGGDKVQILANGTILIQSISSSIVLRSSTGVLII